MPDDENVTNSALVPTPLSTLMCEPLLATSLFDAAEAKKRTLHNVLSASSLKTLSTKSRVPRSCPLTTLRLLLTCTYMYAPIYFTFGLNQ